MARQKIVQDQDKFILRLPDGLRDELKACAADNNRSMNAEILLRIQGFSSRSARREHFAGLAMQTLCNPNHYSIKEAAGLAVAAADALIAELAKGGE